MIHRCSKMLHDNFLINAPGGWQLVVPIVPAVEGQARVAITFQAPPSPSLLGPTDRPLRIPICACGAVAPPYIRKRH